MIQCEHGISIYQKYHIIKKIIQEYWGTKTKDEVKFQKELFTVDTYYKKKIFMNTPLIEEEVKVILN